MKITGTPSGASPQPTPKGGVQPSADSRATQFHASPVAWNAHLPANATTSTTTTTTTAATTTTTATTTSTATATTTATTGTADTMPDWLRKLPRGYIRGDECFRQRYGDHVSLSSSDGRVATGFTSDEKQCHVSLRNIAESLGALMQIRNRAIAELSRANKALGLAETRLQGEQAKIDAAQKAALRSGVPLDSVALSALEKNVAKARDSRDAAQVKCDGLTVALGETQECLVILYDKVKDKVLSSDKDLTAQHQVAVANIAADRDFDRLAMGSASISPTAMVYAAGFCLTAGANILANNLLDFHISEVGRNLLTTFDASTGAGQLLGSVLRSAGVDTNLLSNALTPVANSEQPLALSEFDLDVVCSVLIGLVLAHLLVRSGWLDL